MPESFPMNGGDGTYSYSKNSQYQREASNTAKEMIMETIVDKLDLKSLTVTSKAIRIADLGCSVGPNTFIVVENVIGVVEQKYSSKGLSSEKLEFQVFFNDHVSNDFNTLFASLPPDRQYFATGVPGSFYERLFPTSSLHFVHSAYALQWLSKLPEKLLDKNSPTWNKGRIHYIGASDEVMSAYAAQFEKDMEIFLNARAKEIIDGGMMVIIMPGLPDDIHHSELPAGILFNFLGSSLMDMVNAGIISESQVDLFNLPIYAATPKEMTRLVEKNGCFSIEKLELTEPRSKMETAFNVPALIMHLRAGMEEVFAQHFGREIIHELFERTSQKHEAISHQLESSYMKGTQLFVVLKRK
ncbi:LAMT/FAMT [Ilex paraguariensis]|uniref:LAMT/FAMT protein n=1 Tax=Ilex paraguariensis TaxID=185542 RepID=A0ABC8U7R1_9AQUA